MARMTKCPHGVRHEIGVGWACSRCDEESHTLPLKKRIAELEAHDLKDISERLRTQDNRITAEPMFCVQEKRREYGYDPHWAEDHVWLDDEGNETEAAAEGAVRLAGYKDFWHTVMAAFTEQGCKDYLAVNGHHHDETRIYAESFYRCNEMIRIRAWLMANGQDPK